MIKIIESPREAMQGIVPFIPTDIKAEYVDALLKVGFDSVEIGSFVSPKAVPQMSDSAELFQRVEKVVTASSRMLLVVNRKGAEMASQMAKVDVISYPFSISPKFSELNLNSTPERQLETVKEIYGMCQRTGKKLVVYISMAFGNPYGDEWNLGILSSWIGKLNEIGIAIIPLSNVTIEIDETLIGSVFSTLIPQYPSVELGLHLHTANLNWKGKVEAAYDNGCRRFDSVMQGMGGCPMTGKEMLGNLATENLVQYLREKNELPSGFDLDALERARRISRKFTTAKPPIFN
jgi:hydroxymethylglutaryl-CoA lyase